ncbi:MAG TPA: hypothetical protein VHG90_16375 [Acidimicrobiales bacterium]|nr:hypothetical protein [Acidimicrobiales bacterium]
MTDEETPDDVSVPETLGGALGAVPPPPRPSEESSVFSDASRELRLETGRPVESRVSRFVNWLRWAAAPLGFFLFLAGLTAFGLLKDETTTDTGDQMAANPQPAVSAPPTTVAAPTTVPATAPPTTVAAPVTAPPPTEPPPTEPAPTEPPQTAPPQTAPPAPSSARSAPAASPRYGPACGYRPGQTVRITINGRPAGTATADANGCVTVR